MTPYSSLILLRLRTPPGFLLGVVSLSRKSKPLLDMHKVVPLLVKRNKSETTPPDVVLSSMYLWLLYFVLLG